MARHRSPRALLGLVAAVSLATCVRDTTGPTTTASQLVFLPQPGTLVAGHQFSPVVKVRAEDAAGSTATGFGASVTIALKHNPGGATLAGTTTVTAVNGVATFFDLSLDKADTGYALEASSYPLPSITSATFDVVPGPPRQLAFTVEPPASPTAGVAFTPAVQVSVLDAAGNLVPTYGDSVTVTLGNNPGGGILGGATRVAAVNGVATFTTLTLDKAALGYWLVATATGLNKTTSNAFDVTAGTAAQLVFGTEPGTTVAGHQISPAVKVRALDALGNLVPAFAESVTVALAGNPGGSTLSGTTPVAAASGVATFFDLSLNKTATGYTLTASAPGVTSATSAAFDITPGAARQLAFSVEPATSVAGAALAPAVQVSVLDASGNLVPAFSGTVSVALGNNPGGGALGGTTSVGAVNGVATFGNLTLDKASNGYWLTATATGLSTATSTSFSVTPAVATQLVFGTEPGTTMAGHQFSPAVKVRALDAFGNVATGFAGEIGIALGANPGGAALAGTTPVVATSGVATFFDLSLNKTGSGYALIASAVGFAPVTSTAFDITPGTATQLVFSAQPSNTVAGATVSPAVQVSALDAAGNLTPTFTGSVTIALGNNPGGSTLGGTATVAAVGGVATFPGLTLDKTAPGYWLTASSAGLSTATSSSFNVTAGAAVQLSFGTEPGTTIAGRQITPAVKVRALDALGNLVPTFTGSVSIALGANPGGATLGGTTPVAAVGGIASFFDLSINRTGAGYTLVASATGFAAVTSTAFDITPGTATQLVFSIQPSNTVAGAAISPAVQVSALDAAGNLTPTFTGSVTIALGNNPGGSTLGGTATIAAIAGVATFSTLTLDKAAPGYWLTATSTGLGAGTSASFSIAAGTATQLAFGTEPSATVAGHQITPAVKVRALDPLGNLVPTFAGSVSIAVGNNPGGGVLGGTTPVSAVGGVATFPDLSINKTGAGYTLVASATGFAAVTSTAFDITPGTATQLVFSVQPSNTVAGAAISPAVQVSALDAAGNLTPTFTGSVTIALGNNPGGSTLGGTTTVAAAGGVATFSALTLDKESNGYWLTATSTGLSTATSNSFNITAGSPSQLVFGTAPGTTIAGHQITPAVKVRAVDALGNLVPGFTGNVSIALGNNPGGGVLSGTTPVAAIGGVATFPDLSINKTGTGYTLTAAASGFAPATSAPFDITPGTATQLVFTVQPSNTVAGTAISPAVQVTALDAAGNLVPTFIGTVTVALGNNPGGSTLGGTTTVGAVGGVATFSTLTLDKTSPGYWFTATATGLSTATSTSFSITAGGATELVFGTQPSTTIAGHQITPAVKVRALDALGNLVPTFTGTVNVALGNNPGGATLSGTTPVAAIGGVATFTDLSVNKAAAGYTLTASATGFAPVTSTAFDVTPGTATQLVFTVQPSNTVAGAAIAPAVQVTALDAANNIVPTFTGNVTIVLGNNPGGSTLGGTTAVAAVGGVAVFSTLTLDKTSTGYWLTATATGLSTATSNSFNITAGSATQLVFATQPSTTIAGHQITPAVKVRAVDALGNLVPGFTGNVSIAIAVNPGGGTLGGTTPVAAVGGVATFTDLIINKTGAGYALSASASGFTAVTSTAFDITPGTATQLVFSVQPSNTVAGAAITPAVQVTALDAAGNLVPTFAGNIAIALGNNPGGSTLGGTTTVAAVSGVATFATLTLDKTSNGYWLTATATGLSSTTSSSFNITAGTVNQLSFGTEPATTVAGRQITPAVKVRALDSLGNLVSSYTGNVAVTIGNNPGGGVLSGTTPLAAVGGIATFPDLIINKVGSGYTLTAAAAGFAPVTSTAFDITPGTATQLVFSIQPSNTVAGAAISPVQVSALDAAGNLTPTFTGSVTIALGNNPGGSTLGGTTTVAAVGGVATFSTLTLDKESNGYWLTASATGLSTATSSSFNITAGTPTQLVFGTEPSTTIAGHQITPAVKVRALDVLGNLVPTYTGTVNVALGANPGGATLGGTTPVTAVGGVATFLDLSVNKAATGYTLTASATGFAPVTSTAFDVTPGTATQLVFTVQPSNTVAGAAISPAVQVSALDAAGNLAPTFTGSVTVVLANNPGGSTLGGTTTVVAVGGVATFSTLTLDKTSTGYWLTASSTGLSTATSSSFNIGAGSATQLAFGTEPSTTVAGHQITPAVKVRALDALGNLVPTFTGTVNVALANNPSGATLSGTTPVAAVAGVATFTDLSVNKTAAGYTLSATATGFAPVTSSAFDITTGTATQLTFSVQPSNTVAGVAISPAVQVSALDAANNLVSSFGGTVTIVIANNPGGSTLGGTTAVAAVNGVATFGSLSLDKTSNGYWFTATATGLSAATSVSFNVTAGAAAQLVFGTEPSSTVAGHQITPAVKVRALDALGNLVSGFTGSVSLALANNPGGGTLSGTIPVAAVSGVATFTDLSINRTGLSYTLTASATGLSPVTSTGFDITPGAATQLAFTVQPSTTVAGAAISPAVQVSALDAAGNLTPSFTGSIAVTLGNNPGGSTLGGTTTVAAVNGVASFGDLNLNKSANGYWLTATATSLSTATSASFNVTSAPATQIVFSTQPGTIVAGHQFSPAVKVRAFDAFGNVATGFTSDVTLAIGINPGSGTLSGSNPVAAVSGTATFFDISVNRTGTGYTLTASGGGLGPITSAAFDVTPGSPTQLVFTQQPTSTVAGQAIAPAVQVTALDAAGNPVPTFTGNVTIGFGNNPGGSTLGGTTTVAAVNGVATFNDLTLDKTSNGYWLTATATGLSTATSSAFNISAGPATQLVFGVQPSTITGGTIFNPVVKVRALDALGNLATSFTGNVIMSFGANPGGGPLVGTTTVAAVGGVATFSVLSVNIAATGYTLTASASGFAPVTSVSFDVLVGPPTHLDFGARPNDEIAGGLIGSPFVQLRIEDAGGNLVTTATNQVSVALGANPGGGTLAGTTTVSAVAGLATFTDLTLDKVGVGYTLVFTSPGLIGRTSNTFNISPAAAARVVFTVQPTSTTAGSIIAPAVQVTAVDAFGNVATGFTGNVTVAIGSNPGSSTLGGTTAVAAVNGVATFSDLTINNAGTGYTLTAAAGALTGDTSSPFDVK